MIAAEAFWWLGVSYMFIAGLLGGIGKRTPGNVRVTRALWLAGTLCMIISLILSLAR